MNSGDYTHTESKSGSLEPSDLQQEEELRKEHTLMRKLQNRLLDQLNQETKSSSMRQLLETLMNCCRDLRR